MGVHPFAPRSSRPRRRRTPTAGPETRLSQRHQPAPASAAAASTPSSKRSSWWNAWNTPETSFGCAANESSPAGAACSAASALAAGRRRGDDDDDDASERTARLCGARAPRKGYAAHWPAPSARRHLLPTDGASSVTQSSSRRARPGRHPWGPARTRGKRNAGRRALGVGRSRLFARLRGFVARHGGNARGHDGSSVVTPGSGAAGAAADRLDGIGRRGRRGGRRGRGQASTRGTRISAESVRGDAVVVPRSSSLRKSLSSHGARPRPVSAASTAASWGLSRRKGNLREQIAEGNPFRSSDGRGQPLETKRGSWKTRFDESVASNSRDSTSFWAHRLHRAPHAPALARPRLFFVRSDARQIASADPLRTGSQMFKKFATLSDPLGTAVRPSTEDACRASLRSRVNDWKTRTTSASSWTSVRSP